jgi:hypothetical protein
MSIYQDEKNMSMMPEGILGAYAQGKGAKPIEEKLLALIEKSKRLGLQADKEAAMNKPMPTVADQVEHKTGLMDLQEMAKRLGVQITGIAPIGAQAPQAPQAPQGMPAPQAPMPPAGIAAAPAPMPAPMLAQAAPMPPQAAAPMPAHMAHGGVAHAVPHHMFRFSHGGGIMGFDGKDGSKVPESRQETYGERDVRMHNQPALTSYPDPNSLSNIGSSIQEVINKLPAESGARQLSDYIAAGAPTPEFVKSLRTAPKQTLLDYLGSLINSPATSAPTPVPVPTGDAAAQPTKTPNVLEAEGTKIVPVPNAPVPQAVGDALTKEQPKTPAGLKDALATQRKPASEANPNKVVQSLMSKIPGTAAPAAAPSEPTEKSQAQRIAEGYMTPPSVQAEIQKEKDMAKAFGYDTPAGEDAMRRANAMEAKIAQFQETHPMEKFQALLTGIQTGGYGGGAPAAAENERAYRENVLKQMEAIHNLKSPIEQARRAEAIAKGKNVTENMAKANETASRTATSLFGEEQRAKSAKELEQMRGLNALAVQQLSSATQIKIHQMAQAAADAHRELTAQEIEQSLKNDPKYKDMSYADRLNAAYGIKTGRSEKMGVAELSAIVKATAPIANTDEDAKAQMTWAMGELQKLYTGQNYQPGSAPSLEQFIAKAGPLNPKMTKDQLTAKYTELYGKK